MKTSTVLAKDNTIEKTDIEMEKMMMVILRPNLSEIMPDPDAPTRNPNM